MVDVEESEKVSEQNGTKYPNGAKRPNKARVVHSPINGAAMPCPGPGRKKGGKNRYTIFKQRLVDAVETAAEMEGMTPKQYLGKICKGNPLAFIGNAVRVVPKEIKQTTELTLAGLLSRLDGAVQTDNEDDDED